MFSIDTLASFHYFVIKTLRYFDKISLLGYHLTKRMPTTDRQRAWWRPVVLQWNSWTTFLVEVSGHNIESSEIWVLSGFLPSFFLPTKCYSRIESSNLVYVDFFVCISKPEFVISMSKNPISGMTRQKSVYDCISVLSSWLSWWKHDDGGGGGLEWACITV